MDVVSDNGGGGKADPDDTTQTEETTTTPPASTTKPKSGEITADDKTRYLASIVARNGLSLVADEIVEDLKDYDNILIVDSLETAINDFYYRDITNKIKEFLVLVEEKKKDCRVFREKLEEKETIQIDELDEEILDQIREGIRAIGLAGVRPMGFGLEDIPGLVNPVTTAATAISGSLGAIGDILGYFSSDYSIAGQTIADLDDLYIKAMVAGKLNKNGKNIRLINFNLIDKSILLTALSQLARNHLELLSCLEKISPDAAETQLTQIDERLKTLRNKYVEVLVTVDSEALIDIEQAIEDVKIELKTLRKERVTDAQISGLEVHLAALRTKLVEATATDTTKAENALREQIKQVTKQLEQNKDLTDAKKKELTTLRDNLIPQLVKTITTANSKTIETLKREITDVKTVLTTIRENRVSDAQVKAKEDRLAALETKRDELKAVNESQAVKSLKKIIKTIEAQRKEIQSLVQEAKKVVNSSVKITDAISQFVTNITTVPTGGTYAPLILACIQEFIHPAPITFEEVTINESLPQSEIQYLLKLDIVSAGADFISKRRPPFWRGVDTSYLGGGAVSYVLVDKTGRVLAANTVAKLAALSHRIGGEPKFVEWKEGA